MLEGPYCNSAFIGVDPQTEGGMENDGVETATTPSDYKAVPSATLAGPLTDYYNYVSSENFVGLDLLRTRRVVVLKQRDVRSAQDEYRCMH
jgi:hypothetical protein